MKSFRNLILSGGIAFSVLIAGCGGSSTSIEGLPKGEGNIPIGRAQNKEMGECAITLELSDGRTYNTFTHQQVVYAPVLPQGVTRVTIVPGNRRFNRYTFEYMTGKDQFWSFNARPLARVATQVVKDIDVNLSTGETFKVGQTFRLNVDVQGVGLDGVKPTVFVNGGTARLDAKDVLTFTKSGFGEIAVELLGFRRIIEFNVEP